MLATYSTPAVIPTLVFSALARMASAYKRRMRVVGRQGFDGDGGVICQLDCFALRLTLHTIAIQNEVRGWNWSSTHVGTSLELPHQHCASASG